MVYIIIAILLFLSLKALQATYLQMKELKEEQKKSKKLVEDFEKEYPINDKQ